MRDAVADFCWFWKLFLFFCFNARRFDGRKKKGSSACKIIMLNKSDTVTVINFYNLYLWLYFYCTQFSCVNVRDVCIT